MAIRSDGESERAAVSAKSTIARVVGVSFHDARSGTRQRPVEIADSSFSCTWSIVELAAFMRGG